jgi:hypothetical protein
MININNLIKSSKFPSEAEILATLSKPAMPVKLNSPSSLLKIGKCYEKYNQYYNAALCYALAAKRGNIKGYHALITVLGVNEQDSIFCDATLLEVDVVLCKSQLQQLLLEQGAFLKKLAIQRRIKDLHYSGFKPLQDLLLRVEAIDVKLYRADELLSVCEQELITILPRYQKHLSIKLAASLIDVERRSDADEAMGQHVAVIQAIDAVVAVNKDNCEDVILLCKKAFSIMNETYADRKRLLMTEIEKILSQLFTVSSKNNQGGAIGALLQRPSSQPLQPELANIRSSLSVLQAKTNLLEIENANFHDSINSYCGQLDEIIDDVRNAQQRGLHQLKTILDSYHHADTQRINYIRNNA